MTAPKKTKAYYAWLATRKNLSVPRTELIRMSLEKLKNLSGKYDNLKLWKGYCEWRAKSPWMKLKGDDLVNELKSRGLPYSGRTKEMMAMTLETTTASREPDLDEDQRKFLATTEPRVLLHAGPGAGKTTTLCALAAIEANNNPDSRILFLVYTKAAQRAISEKIRKRGAKVLTPKAVVNNTPGIYSLTLNEYAYRRHPTEFSTSNSGFDKSLRKAIEQEPAEWERWDICILDEAQDIVPMHEKLVNQIAKRSKRVIFAGDARQQIYTGASFLTKVWKDKSFVKCVLRYNHRSAPEIVEMLNAFSREHFGEHHIEQIATSKAKGVVSAVITDSRGPKQRFIDAGRYAAQVMCHNSDSYCILPVSVQKYYGTDTAVMALRQEVCDLRGPLVKVLHKNTEKYNPTSTSVLYIGTAYKLKGTEKDTTVVMQADVKYDELNIERRALACLLYVALSRPRLRLIIMLNGKTVRNKGLLACVAKYLNASVAPVSRSSKFLLPFRVTVRDNLVLWPRDIKTSYREELTALPKQSLIAPDFLGILVEGHLAKITGATNKIEDIKYVEAETHETFEYYFEKYSEDGDTKLRLIIRAKSSQLKNIQKIVSAIWGGKGEVISEYLLAQLIYTAKINKLWTLGEEFKDDDFKGLSVYAEAVRKVGGPAITRGRRHTFPLTPHRAIMDSPKTTSTHELGYIVGVTDIETETHVVEIKHAVDMAEHHRQVCIYAALSGKRPLLVNTKTGVVEEKAPLGASDRSHIFNFARAKLAGIQATYAKIRTQGRLNYDSTFAGDNLDLVLAVDVETADNYVVEVGAVLFSKADGEIIDVFHAVSGAVTEDKSPKRLEKEDVKSPEDAMAMCGFGSIDYKTVGFAGNALIAEFASWRSRQSPHVFLQWGGSDAKQLRMKNVRCADMRRFYLAWLDQNGQSRKGETSLAEAVAHIFGDEFFLPHRAFEDAVATMSLFIALEKSA
jgi:hypothetical protein